MPGLVRLLGEPALSDIEREVGIAPVTRPDVTGKGTGSGKSVLVTGSSSGIGLASVVALSNRGWKVFASMRDVSRADRLELALGDRATSVRVVQLDVTDQGCDHRGHEGGSADDWRTPRRARAQLALVEPGTVKTPIWQHQLEQSTDDRYRAWAADLEQRTATGVKRFGRDPFEVGEAIAEVVAAPHPHFRNPVGPDSWTMWAVSKAVPASWRNRGLALIMHAPRPASSGG
jgi:NAD(P)-dependent dehydrogenase (short-subunit alcohol dehydrogenase family)